MTGYYLLEGTPYAALADKLISDDKVGVAGSPVVPLAVRCAIAWLRACVRCHAVLCQPRPHATEATVLTSGVLWFPLFAENHDHFGAVRGLLPGPRCNDLVRALPGQALAHGAEVGPFHCRGELLAFACTVELDQFGALRCGLRVDVRIPCNLACAVHCAQSVDPESTLSVPTSSC